MSVRDTVFGYIAKMREFDHDDRYMAISDLLSLLKEHPHVDGLHDDICSALLERLDKDKSNDVQTVTIACLSQLLQNGDGVLVAGVCDALADRILRTKSKIKDIYSIGLKTIISGIPDALGKTVSTFLIENIITGIAQSDEAIKTEFLDILPKLLARFGSFLGEFLAKITSVTLDQLDLNLANINKRASRVFFHLAPWLSTPMLNSLMSNLLDKVDQCGATAPSGPANSDSSDSDSSSDSSSDEEDEADSSTPAASPYIQSINAIAESVASRLQPSSARLVGTMLRSIGAKRSKRMGSKSFIELREQCFATISACIGANHTLESSLIAQVTSCALSFLNYDPNFIDSDSESESDDDDSESADEGDEQDQYDVEYEDTDDTSWKVRQSCLTLLKALVGGRVDGVTAAAAAAAAGEAAETPTSPTAASPTSALGQSTYLAAEAYARCFKSIVSRFSERESTVQLSVFETLSAYVQYGASGSEGARAAALEVVGSIIDATGKFLRQNCSAAAVKRKSAALRAVGTLLRLLGDILTLTAERPAFSLDKFLEPLSFAMTQNDVILKLAAFKLVHQVLVTPATKVSDTSLDSIMHIVLKAAGDRWYRVATAALTIVLAFEERFLDGRAAADVRTRTASYATRYDLYQCLQPLAFGAKKDQVVKDLALQCIAILIARAGDALGRELVVSALTESTKRLPSEVLRISILQTLRRIVETELNLGVDRELVECLHSLFELLRQNDRKVKVLALQLLADICSLFVRQHSDDGDAAAADGLREAWEKLEDVVAIMRGDDVFLCRLAFKFVSVLVAAASLESAPAVEVLRSIINDVCNALGRSQQMQVGSTTLQYAIDLARSMSRRSSSLRESAAQAFLQAGSEAQGGAGRGESAGDGGARQAAAAKCLAVVLAGITQRSDVDAAVAALALLPLPEVSDTANPTLQAVAAASKEAQAAEADTPGKAAFLLQTLGELCCEQTVTSAASPDVFVRAQAALEKRCPSSEAAFALGTSARTGPGALAAFWGIWQQVVAAGPAASPAPKLHFVLLAVRDMLAAEAEAGHAAVDSAHCQDLDSKLLSPLLSSELDSMDSATNRVLGECCGLLLLHEPGYMLPRLHELLSSGSIAPAAKQQVLNALQTFVSDNAATSHLSIVLAALCGALSSEAPPANVALAAVSALNALVHHHPNFIGPSECGQVWGAVLRQMPVRPDLKRVVDLGPFKQKIDDGLPIRKAAYTCAATLLQQVPAHVTRACGSGDGGFLSQLTSSIVAGLKETEYDARVLAQQMLLKLCVLESQETSSRASELLSPFSSKLKKTKLSTDGAAAANQQERNLVTASVRTIFALSTLQDPPHPLTEHSEFKQLLTIIQQKPALRVIWEDAAQ
eukprot:INCI13901.4.p1 GENE.INCI13901.4~~INCI13901.4.p1  ORF type:complete len:1371 (-),score=290.46 INCI13901.4:201-4313(-)